MRIILSALLALASLSSGLRAETSTQAEPPNIVFIFADDLGYNDLSCYGADLIKTPNIDQLAKDGTKFTDAHSAASLCSPSRYGLLTGKAPWRLGKKGNGYRLDEGQLNIASLLKPLGYQSAAIGKWHLGYSKDWNKLPITGPLERGFDYHFGVPSNHNDGTRVFIENNDLYGRKPGEKYEVVKGLDLPKGISKPRVEDQVDTTLTQKAIDFIQRSKDGPFFLYFTPCCPHTFIAPAEEFRGSSKAGLLGDYIQELDHHVGNILKTLDELGLRENTLVIFTSDNGGSPKDFKGTNHVKLNLASKAGDILNKYKTAKIDARAMGHLTNGIWQDGKGYPQEGGHRIPFIARWPGKVPADKTSDYLFSLTDILATAADLAGAKLPDEGAEDSFSILPVLLGKKPTVEREALFILGDGKADAIAVCSGRWKAIARKDDAWKEVAELYDLEADPGETANVIDKHPKIAKRLNAALQKANQDGRTRP
ncbi:arylsulfatase [bacterium]|nr:arylsulfatase [bacterium]MDB4378021.1 arylsulfatase [Akkermansiaceae bacterium]